MITEKRTLLRDNFNELADWAGASGVWPLSAPVPALHLKIGIARIGDTLIKIGEFMIIVPAPHHLAA